MKDVDYASGKAPPDYRCASCGAHGVKLWREYQCFNPVMFCVACAETGQERRLSAGGVDAVDTIGWLVPAVPDEEGLGFWGYTSVPAAGVAWWKALPMAQPQQATPAGSFSPSGRPLSEPVEVRVSGLRGTPTQVAEELRRLAAQVEHGERFASSCCGCKVSVGSPPRSGPGST